MQLRIKPLGIAASAAVAMAAEPAVKTIPGATLARLDGLRHAPQIVAPDRFPKTLLDAIKR